MPQAEGQAAPAPEQKTKPGILNRDPDKVSLDNAVARLLKEPEAVKPEATPKKEPERKQLEEHEEEGEELESEGESEYEEEDDAGDDPDKSENSDNPDEYEEESEDTEGDDEGELVFTIKLDGEDYEVTADELKSGYQRQKDYTKKTQQLAEQRKDYEAKLSEITGQHNQFLEQAQIANQLLNRDLEKFKKVDWDKLKADDPVGYVQKQIEYQDTRDQQTQLRQQAQLVHEANLKSQKDAYDRNLEVERKQALEYFPEWKSKDKAAVHQAKNVEYGRTLGFTDEELATISSAKALLIMDKARQFDSLQNTKKGITQKVKPAMRKLVKPKGKAPKGSAQRKHMAEGRERLQKSGSIRDAAALMYEMRNSKVITKPNR